MLKLRRAAPGVRTALHPSPGSVGVCEGYFQGRSSPIAENIKPRLIKRLAGSGESDPINIGANNFFRPIDNSQRARPAINLQAISHFPGRPALQPAVTDLSKPLLMRLIGGGEVLGKSLGGNICRDILLQARQSLIEGLRLRAIFLFIAAGASQRQSNGQE